MSDDEDCGDTDEHIIHSANQFNPSGMMSASDSGATSSQQLSSQIMGHSGSQPQKVSSADQDALGMDDQMKGVSQGTFYPSQQ